MTRSSHVRTAVVGALALVAGLTAAGPADAVVPAASLCSALSPAGYVHDRTVEGDVVADVPCTLWNVVVTGDLVLDAVDVRTDRVTVEGDVRSAGEDGPAATAAVHLRDTVVRGSVTTTQDLHLDRSTVQGEVDLGEDRGQAVVVERAVVVGGVRGNPQELLLDQAGVLGPVDVRTGEALRVRRSVVGSDLTARGGRLVVHSTAVVGSLTAEATQDVLVCRSTVREDLTVREVRLWGRVGEEGAEPCTTRVDGSVHLVDNPSSVILGAVHVGGDLTCEGNAGSLGVALRDTLVVDGARGGQCAPTGGAPAAEPGAVPAPAAPAARPVRVCSERSPVVGVVEADVLVDGTPCLLVGATVLGDVVLRGEATLSTTQAVTVTGDVRGEGMVTLSETTVHGEVDVVAPPYWESLVGASRVAGGVRLDAYLVTFVASAVGGDVRAASDGAVRLRQGTAVGGSVDVEGGYVRAHDSTVLGSLRYSGPTDVIVCRSDVGGDLEVTGARYWSTIGQERTERCRVTVGGSVRLVDNVSSVVVDDVHVAGDLACTGNTGPRVVVRTERLTVAGARTGQCAP